VLHLQLFIFSHLSVMICLQSFILTLIYFVISDIFFEVRLAGRTKWSLVFRKGTFVTNLHYVFIYYILDNLIWLYFPLKPIEKSNRPIVDHVVRLPMRFKQGELKVSRHMYFEWSTHFVFK
jgi:hypothetical protein